MVGLTIVAILGALWFARHGLCVRRYPVGVVNYEASEREGRLVLELTGYEYSDRCTGAFVGHDLWWPDGYLARTLRFRNDGTKLWTFFDREGRATEAIEGNYGVDDPIELERPPDQTERTAPWLPLGLTHVEWYQAERE